MHFKTLVGKWKKIHESSNFEFDLSYFVQIFHSNNQEFDWNLETRRYHCNINDKRDFSIDIVKDNYITGTISAT